MSLRRVLAAVAILMVYVPVETKAQNVANEGCLRPRPGSTVAEPVDPRSHVGVLQVDLTIRNYADSNGQMRYCYVTDDGRQSPNLRVSPGDLLIVSLKNQLAALVAAKDQQVHTHAGQDPCAGGKMTATSTNLHFHGLSIPPVCHEDDVLNTSIQPDDPAFEYRIRIPANQPPGLYWYHPHLHGFSKVQVLGGASGALIIEGIERAIPDLAGIPERILVIRAQDLLNPDAPPTESGTVAPPVVLDPDGDVRNTGSGTGKPAKDLSVNFVPVPYPSYEPAIITMKPAERQLWRVLNASAITYLNLQVLFGGVPQGLAMVGLDGVPLNQNGLGGKGIVWQNHAGIPPGGRAEFVIQGPAEGIEGELLTRSVNTGPGGENDPVRRLARIIGSKDAPELRSRLAVSTEPIKRPTLPWLGTVKPSRTRKLYFSEVQQDPSDPNSPTRFFLTVDGQIPTPFDPNSSDPNIVVHQGDVEDWIIENRSQELHAFHIHQVHFMLLE